MSNTPARQPCFPPLASRLQAKKEMSRNEYEEHYGVEYNTDQQVVSAPAVHPPGFPPLPSTYPPEGGPIFKPTPEEFYIFYSPAICCPLQDILRCEYAYTVVPMPPFFECSYAESGIAPIIRDPKGYAILPAFLRNKSVKGGQMTRRQPQIGQQMNVKSEEPPSRRIFTVEEINYFFEPQPYEFSYGNRNKNDTSLSRSKLLISHVAVS